MTMQMHYNRVVLVVAIVAAVFFIVGFLATANQDQPTGYIILQKIGIAPATTSGTGSLATTLGGGGKITVPTTEGGGGKI